MLWWFVMLSWWVTFLADNWTDYSRIFFPVYNRCIFQSCMMEQMHIKPVRLSIYQPVQHLCFTYTSTPPICLDPSSLRLHHSVHIYTSPGFLCSRGATCNMFSRCFFSPPVQAGRGALRVEQAPERQVHGSHGAPLLEHGTEHQSVRPQAVWDDQVSRRIFHFQLFVCVICLTL